MVWNKDKIKKKFIFKETQIKKITKTNYSPKQVYNLSVEDDESFVVNGLLVHNTKPHPFIRKVLDEQIDDLFYKVIKNLGSDAVIKR